MLKQRTLCALALMLNGGSALPNSKGIFHVLSKLINFNQQELRCNCIWRLFCPKKVPCQLIAFQYFNSKTVYSSLLVFPVKASNYTLKHGSPPKTFWISGGKTFHHLGLTNLMLNPTWKHVQIMLSSIMKFGVYEIVSEIFYRMISYQGASKGNIHSFCIFGLKNLKARVKYSILRWDEWGWVCEPRF